MRRLASFAVLAVFNASFGVATPAPVHAKTEKVKYALEEAEFQLEEDVGEIIPGVYDRYGSNSLTFDPFGGTRPVGFVEDGGKAGARGRIKVPGTMDGTLYDRIMDTDCSQGPCEYKTVCEVTEDYLGVPEVIQVDLSRPPGKDKIFLSKWRIPEGFATEECSNGVELLAYPEPVTTKFVDPRKLREKTTTLTSKGVLTQKDQDEDADGLRTLQWNARIVLRRLN